MHCWAFGTLAAAFGVALSSADSTSYPLAIDVQLVANGAVTERSRAAFDAEGPVGWRMNDRFYAFRFELELPSGSVDSINVAMEDVASLARAHRCFGWIQQIDGARVAGEVRCPKGSAYEVESHLYAAGDRLTLRHYPKSKIRYHFPSFRVLSEPKYRGKTCFQSPPHACSSAKE
jgi:hypothetical protein